MRFVTLITSLVDANAPMPSAEKVDFKNDLIKEWDSVQYSDEYLKQNPEKASDPQVIFRRKTTSIWARLAFIVVYVIATKHLREYLNPRPDYFDPRYFNPEFNEKKPSSNTWN